MNKFLQYIELNLSELCNFTCPFCPRGHGYPNTNVHMTVDTAKEIAKQIKDLGQPIALQFAGRGEPTLCKNFGEIAQVFLDLREEIPLTIEINTNGNRTDKYLDVISQFDYIVYNVYAENNLSFEDAQKKYPNFMVKDKTKPESRGWKTRAGYIPDVVNGHKDFIHHKYGGLCHKPFEVVYIDYQGNYNLCCDVWKDIEVLGNIYDEPIKEYTASNPRLMEYRKRLAQGKRDMHPCKDCNLQCSVEFLMKIQELKDADKQGGTRS